ncbi:MAG: hypothetical protein ACRDTP_08880 [Mycobacteriales bacterium]
MSTRLAAGAAAVVLGAGLSIAAVPASAAPATHTVTYSPGLLPVLGALGITIVPGVSPSISAPDGGAVHAGDTIVFKSTASAAVTVTSTTSNWSFSLPLSAAKPASVTVPAAPGTYGYGVGKATGTFTTASSSASNTSPSPSQPSGGGGILGGGGQQAAPPTATSDGGGAQPTGAGAGAGGGSGTAGTTGSRNTGTSFNKAQFGSGSGDFPRLPGGVLAPVDPQAGPVDEAPPPDVAALPLSDADGDSPMAMPNSSGEPISNASQIVGGTTTSSVTGPAAAAAALLALVAVGLSRAWIDQRPLHRH